MHYRDGTEAKLGDLVKGVTYNRDKREIVGVVVSLTPGTESCNCVVAFATIKNVELPEGQSPYVDPWPAVLAGKAYLAGDGHGGELNKVRVILGDYDYGETRAFDLLARAS